MNELSVFSFETREIRTATDNQGTPWFIAKDVSETLGYSETSKGLAHCRKPTVLGDVNKINNLHPSTKWIPESDVYRMAIRSNLPSAERFQDWVVEDVLPTIRKTGQYQTQPITNINVDLVKISTDIAPGIAAALSAFGLSGNQLALSANKAVTEICGVNLLKLGGLNYLPAPVHSQSYTATEIGGQLIVKRKSQAVNKLLTKHDFQISKRVNGSIVYEATEKGKQHSEMVDVPASNGSRNRKQLRWFKSIISELDKVND